MSAQSAHTYRYDPRPAHNGRPIQFTSFIALGRLSISPFPILNFSQAYQHYHFAPVGFPFSYFPFSAPTGFTILPRLSILRPARITIFTNFTILINLTILVRIPVLSFYESYQICGPASFPIFTDFTLPAGIIAIAADI